MQVISQHIPGNTWGLSFSLLPETKVKSNFSQALLGKQFCEMSPAFRKTLSSLQTPLHYPGKVGGNTATETPTLDIGEWVSTPYPLNHVESYSVSRKCRDDKRNETQTLYYLLAGNGRRAVPKVPLPKSEAVSPLPRSPASQPGPARPHPPAPSPTASIPPRGHSRPNFTYGETRDERL